MSKKISLTYGLYTLVDEDDFNQLDQYNWYVKKVNSNVVYAARGVQRGEKYNKRVIKMHQHIMGEMDGYVIDHINGDGLDNRKENLRFITQKENTRRCKLSKNNTSGYNGVTFNKDLKKWVAQIHVDYKCIILGYSKNIEEAYLIRKLGELKYYGFMVEEKDLKEINISNTPTPKHKYKKRKNCKSKYKGITFFNGRWRVRFLYKESRKYIGHFNNEIDAAKCYIKEYERVYGEKPYEI